MCRQFGPGQVHRADDLRNERHVERLTESEIVKSASTVPTSEAAEIAESKSVLVKPKPKKSTTSGWSDWWVQKKANNEAFLLAAELGDLQKLKKYSKQILHHTT